MLMTTYIMNKINEILKTVEDKDWQPLNTAPKDKAILGKGTNGCAILPMKFMKMEPKTGLDRSWAVLLFGDEGPLWWALYPDGRIGSFLPTDGWKELPEEILQYWS